MNRVFLTFIFLAAVGSMAPEAALALGAPLPKTSGSTTSVGASGATGTTDSSSNGATNTTTPVTASSMMPPGPKIRVGIVPAEDRWITLTDGSKVYQGVEISYLLGNQLLQSGQFVPSLVPDSTVSVDTSANASSTTNGTASSALMTAAQVQTQQMTPERLAQIPQEWTQWVQDQAALDAATASSAQTMPSTSASTENSFQEPVAVTIKPVVETLLYASGAHSDRVVFGFSPDHLNPFNEGRAGSLDNEFIASPEQEQSCVKPDFFNGQFNPQGWGPGISNFGSTLDEGVVINIFGFGFGFQQKKFQIHSQIRFIIDDHITGQHQELVFQTIGSGSDVFVAGSYDGFSLGLEIQRQKTLVAALQQMLPQIINQFITQGFSATWQGSIISTANNEIVLNAGQTDGVTVGMQMESATGNIYQVASVYDTISDLVLVTGFAPTNVGDAVRYFTGTPLNWGQPNIASVDMNAVRMMQASQNQSVASNLAQANITAVTNDEADPTKPTEKVTTLNMNVSMDQSTRAQAQAASVAGCVAGSKPGWFAQLIDDLSELYAWWRYENVYDQKIHTLPSAKVIAANATAPKILLVDSGIDYNDSTIRNYIVLDSQNQVQGFDFISWDPRAADDNGHGSAAAKMMIKNIKVPFAIIPAKVVGTNGETNSSAIYEAFEYGVKNNVAAIVAPWSSETQTLTAYQMGAQLAAQANIPVFTAPNTVIAASSANIYVPTANGKTFKTSSMSGASVRVGPEGAAAISMLSTWMNSTFGGGHK